MFGSEGRLVSARCALENTLDPGRLQRDIVQLGCGAGLRARTGKLGGRRERLCERVDVERVDEDPCLGRDELRRAADPRSDDRPAARHRLEERLAERLDEARLADDPGLRDASRHLVVRDAGDELDSRPAFEPPRSGPSPTKVSVPAGSRLKASARRTTFLRSVSAPRQRKDGLPFGGAGSTRNRSRSTPESITSVLPRASGTFASSSRRR
jgi:hypothetical protein